jgi:flavin-dependent dehydrogenase
MDTCDVLIVGGGPAGSACAWALNRAGVDVVVMDRAMFPRDKVCAGWITPPVVEALRLDTNEYRRGRTFQPFTGFRVGVVGGDRTVETRYGAPVSFGIRRCEFDEYLLRRSGARLALGAPAASIVRDDGRWVVNDAIRAPMLVGAGGHFCPVARSINREERTDRATALVVAQEAEFAIDPGDEAAFTTASEVPELYFCRDMRGYGWSVRKEQHLNVGFGRLDCRSLPRAIAEFVAFLEASGTVRGAAARCWHGHAYLVSTARRRAVDAGVLLVGDAAGLAYPQSGEGIRPAVQSGLVAARTIIDAAGRYTREHLQGYETWLREMFGTGAPVRGAMSQLVPAAVWTPLARRLLASPAFVRHVVLNRGFLHA